MTHPRPHPRDPRPRRSAFTLIEALVASTLLGVVVLAVISAVSSAQALSFEGRKQILASMAADDLMTELVSLPYDDIALHDGLDQPIGGMVSLAGVAYPPPTWPLGRTVSVTAQTVTEPSLGVEVAGVRIVVTVRDEHRDLARLETFVPDDGA